MGGHQHQKTAGGVMIGIILGLAFEAEHGQEHLIYEHDHQPRTQHRCNRQQQSLQKLQ